MRNFSVYGMATWTFLDDFELQFGARQNWEQKSFDIEATSQPESATEARPVQKMTMKMLLSPAGVGILI